MIANLIFCNFFSLVLTFFSFSNKNNDPIPGHQTFTIYSQILKEDRVINVWTPADYNSNQGSLPVVYMLDGGIKEDFPHLANTLAKLISENKIPPAILVGIENTQRRRDLTGFTTVAKDKEIAKVVGGAENFRAFVKEELFVEVNKRYRTTSEKTIIGESLAGLFVMETFFLTPQMFDHYIAFDPSLWWNNHLLVKSAQAHLNKLTDSPVSLWYAGSDAKDISKHTKKLEKILKKTNLKNLRWTYSNEPEEQHSTIFRATKEKAFIWTLGKND